MDYTTIQLKKKTLKKLQAVREHPRQPYNELIVKMIDIYKKAKNSNQYDEFLHKVQMPKMKELWDNDEDEAWEDA